MGAIINVLKSYSQSKLSGYNSDNALVDIAYNNSAIKYRGRWIDTGTGMWSGWGGSRVTFKVKGTGILNIKAAITDTTSSEFVTVTLYAYPLGIGVNPTVFPTTASETFTGTKWMQLPITRKDIAYQVEIYLFGPAANQFDLSIQTIVQAYTTGSLAILSQWNEGATVLQGIGDSWFVDGTSWVRLLDRSVYDLYLVSSPRMTCAVADANYNYDYTGVLNTTDPVCNKALISFGVNDWIAGATVPAFQASLLSLIDKVRIKQPGIPIVLVRVPNNVGTGDNYGQYGTAMSNAAGLRTGITYIDTSSLDASMTWQPDNQHLDTISKAAFVAYVQPLM